MTQSFPFDHFIETTKHNNNKMSDSNTLASFTTKAEPEQSIDELNFKIHQKLLTIIPEAKYNTYFNNNFSLISINQNEILFNTKTAFIKSMIEEYYQSELKEIVTKFVNPNLKIKISSEESSKFKDKTTNSLLDNIKIPVDQKSSSVSNVKFKFPTELNHTQEDKILKVESKYINHMYPSEKGLAIDPSKTFQNFLVGPSNNMAFATAMAVAKEPSTAKKPGRYPSLYVYSDSGLGKTHLLHAIANEIKEHSPTLIICLITARAFMQEMITAIQEKKLPDFQKKYSQKVDVLMIDDIHELKNKHATQNEFFHVFNELHNKGKQLIFTSDKLPKEIDGIAERVKTRLQWGLVIDIQKPDLETRMAILKKKAIELDLYLQDDMLSLIAYNIKNSIRELEGTLIKLSAYSDVMKVDIDIQMIKDLLMISEDDSFNQITLESITKATAQYFKIPIADLKSKSRIKEIAKARHIGMYLSHKLIQAKLQEIGAFYGGRDHSSVLHGIKRITDSLRADSFLFKEISKIESLL
ncbi:MAG: chromosomal replication initiator protein DnaA [Bdellovibrionales bacterium]|nr:chromosomal replication initiator protein DnaA [Bdellovibrionales bacterium]